MMIHTKLSIRLAYVPWLLAAGLVLGWSEKAVAATSSTSGHSSATNHPHATNPNLVLTYDLLRSGSKPFDYCELEYVELEEFQHG